MGLKAMVSALQEDLITVKVQYDMEDEFPDKVYTFKTRDKSIEKDDIVVVEGGNRLSVVKVYSVDAEPDIDPDFDGEYKWIIQKVDFAEYRENLDKDKQAFNMLRYSMKAKQRKEMIETFKDTYIGEEKTKKLMELLK